MPYESHTTSNNALTLLLKMPLLLKKVLILIHAFFFSYLLFVSFGEAGQALEPFCSV